MALGVGRGLVFLPEVEEVAVLLLLVLALGCFLFSASPAGRIGWGSGLGCRELGLPNCTQTI